MLKEYKNSYSSHHTTSLANEMRQDTVDIRSNFKDVLDHHEKKQEFFYTNLSQPFDIQHKVSQWKKVTTLFCIILAVKIYAIFQDKSLYELGKVIVDKFEKVSISKPLNAVEGINGQDVTKPQAEAVDISKNQEQKKDLKKNELKKEKFFDPMDIDSEIEINTLENLKAEKDKIDKAKIELKAQEESSLLAKEEISLKLKELKKVEESIKELLLKAEEKKKSQLDKYIKIIEGMKTKNAAVIFDKLDMDLLKEIVSIMNPRKVSMILDQMNPAKAKELLTLSMKQQVSYAS